jgi:hypothetical protein
VKKSAPFPLRGFFHDITIFLPFCYRQQMQILTALSAPFCPVFPSDLGTATGT